MNHEKYIHEKYFADLLKKGHTKHALSGGGCKTTKSTMLNRTYAFVGTLAIVFFLIMMNWKRIKTYIPLLVTKSSTNDPTAVGGKTQLNRSTKDSGSKIIDDEGVSDEIDESDVNEDSDRGDEIDNEIDDESDDESDNQYIEVQRDDKKQEELTDSQQLIEYDEDPNFTPIS